jgi:hypothetical protein
VFEITRPDFVPMVFLHDRMDMAVNAEITRAEADGFVSALEERHRSALFRQRFGYNVAGTRTPKR